MQAGPEAISDFANRSVACLGREAAEDSGRKPGNILVDQQTIQI